MLFLTLIMVLLMIGTLYLQYRSVNPGIDSRNGITEAKSVNDSKKKEDSLCDTEIDILKVTTKDRSRITEEKSTIDDSQTLRISSTPGVDNFEDKYSSSPQSFIQERPPKYKYTFMFTTTLRGSQVYQDEEKFIGVIEDTVEVDSGEHKLTFISKKRRKFFERVMIVKGDNFIVLDEDEFHPLEVYCGSITIE